jgi:hypothetical protein
MKPIYTFYALLLALCLSTGSVYAQLTLGIYNGAAEGKDITLKITGTGNYTGQTMTGTFFIIKWATTAEGNGVEPTDFVGANGFTNTDGNSNVYPFYSENGGFSYRIIQITAPAFVASAAYNNPNNLVIMSFNMTGGSGSSDVSLANDAHAGQMRDDYVGGPGSGIYFSDIGFNGAGTVTNFSPATVANVLLPFVLKNFTASEQACLARLQWSTAFEQNTSHFDIEQSTDGTTYSSVGKVAAQGNGTGRTYGYSHATDAQDNFYRLKMVDRDGQFTYSPVVQVKRTCHKQDAFMRGYPNPLVAGQSLQLQWRHAYKGAAQLQVTTNLGQQVHLQTLQLTGGAQNLTLTLPQGLSKGVYFVRLLGAGKEPLFANPTSITVQ